MPADPADRPPPLRRPLYALLGVTAGGTVAVQFALAISGADGTVIGVARAVVFLIGFFTILTNTLVAVVALRLAWRFDGHFARPRVAAAMSVYGTVVLIVYELLLRHLWDPRGVTLLIDTIFHDLVPVAWVLLWWAFVAKGTLRWRDAGPWLVAPLAYGVCVTAAGVMTGEPLYPFLDVTTHGAGRVALNVAALVAAFGGVGLAYVAVDRYAGRAGRV